MIVPQENGAIGAGTDTASVRPSAADAGLRTREEHADDRTRSYGAGATGPVCPISGQSFRKDLGKLAM
jgi:hypothetical protein